MSTSIQTAGRIKLSDLRNVYHSTNTGAIKLGDYYVGGSGRVRDTEYNKTVIGVPTTQANMKLSDYYGSGLPQVNLLKAVNIKGASQAGTRNIFGWDKIYLKSPRSSTTFLVIMASGEQQKGGPDDHFQFHVNVYGNHGGILGNETRIANAGMRRDNDAQRCSVFVCHTGNMPWVQVELNSDQTSAATGDNYPCQVWQVDFGLNGYASSSRYMVTSGPRHEEPTLRRKRPGCAFLCYHGEVGGGPNTGTITADIPFLDYQFNEGNEESRGGGMGVDYYIYPGDPEYYKYDVFKGNRLSAISAQASFAF